MLRTNSPATASNPVAWPQPVRYVMLCRWALDENADPAVTHRILRTLRTLMTLTTLTALTIVRQGVRRAVLQGGQAVPAARSATGTAVDHPRRADSRSALFTAVGHPASSKLEFEPGSSCYGGDKLWIGASGQSFRRGAAADAWCGADGWIATCAQSHAAGYTPAFDGECLQYPWRSLNAQYEQ